MKVSGRICAICHKPGGSAYTLPFKWLGIVGHYAHEVCLRQAKRKACPGLRGDK